MICNSYSVTDLSWSHITDNSIYLVFHNYLLFKINKKACFDFRFSNISLFLIQQLSHLLHELCDWHTSVQILFLWPSCKREVLICINLCAYTALALASQLESPHRRHLDPSSLAAFWREVTRRPSFEVCSHFFLLLIWHRRAKHLC